LSTELEGTGPGGISAEGPTIQIELPSASDTELTQDREWCNVRIDGIRRRIRFHDYGKIYAVPGLYERLFYEQLECCSPEIVRGLLESELDAEGVEPDRLRVLDLGAGNGMVGEELAEAGADSIFGVDLIDEAAMAAERDRPEVYEDYFVLDLAQPKPGQLAALKDLDLNCLVTVAALGFGDIPPRAFANAFDLIEDGGWIAFNIKSDFLEDDDPSGFSRLVEKLFDAGQLEELARREYTHRLNVAGEPLPYVAIVARKHGDVPAELLAAAEA
jgi:predicted TPR repeat methyltransferase